jgi:phosphatidylinositol alpha-1,6-mannosyltransferase
VERKGHATVIRALPDVLRVIPEAHYLIVGTGPVKEELEKLIIALGLEANVTFTGYVSDIELDSLFQLCELFVMVSREIPEKGDIEGFGIVYLEANLFRRPVIAARTGGVPDAVLHEETGLLVEPNDPRETASAIIHLLKNPGLAQELGDRGHDRVLQEFSSVHLARKALKTIEEISR